MPGIVNVVVFSNFEGFVWEPEPAVQWFDACSKAHPAIRWTHMYNPIYLLLKQPKYAKIEAQCSPMLLEAEAKGNAEVGLHLHLFYDLVRVMGLNPRAYPHANDTSPRFDHRRSLAEDRSGGYDVLMTGYSAAERAALLDASIGAFLRRGFRRPTSFCAGYSAADPALQALLVQKQFTTSFAAQAVGPEDYPSGWYHQVDWYGTITPLTLPYRVSRHSILPPPHDTTEYLDLVEVPLNMAVDKNNLYFGDTVVSREEMFDCHFNWARNNGRETAVAIGVHADVVAGERWGSGKVSEVMDRFLTHVSRRAGEGGAQVRFATASAVGQGFWENKTVGSVSRAA
jgi:hypothetical protein